MKLLMSDPQGRMLLEMMNQHKKNGFLDKVRKEHEHEMREHKEFLSTVAKVKNITTASFAAQSRLSQNGSSASVVEEIGRELVAGINRPSAQPVLQELHLLSGESQHHGLKPWSDENRDKLKVIQL